MAIHRMHRDGDVVEVEGSADHLTTEFLPPNAGPTLQAVLIAGLLKVTRVGEGQHNGEASRVFTLSDETGLHEVGRLVVRDDMSLEWAEVYESNESAERRVQEWQAENESPVAETISLGMIKHEGSLELAMANLAAEFGVSIRRSGEGDDEVIVSGLRSKVIAVMESEKGWDFEADDRGYYLND